MPYLPENDHVSWIMKQYDNAMQKAPILNMEIFFKIAEYSHLKDDQNTSIDYDIARTAIEQLHIPISLEIYQNVTKIWMEVLEKDWRLSSICGFYCCSFLLLIYGKM